MTQECVAEVRRSDVVALYVDPLGPYPSLLVHWYDEARDARSYGGGMPVVAHPPCGPWSSLRTLSHETTKELAWHALTMVRSWGGVLEHPCGSKFFDAAGLPRPGRLPDAYGGSAYEVEQCDWGHPARKRTWLYVVGLLGPIPEAPPKASPTHWCSGGGTGRGRTPPGIKVCSAQQRRRTPRAFAEWLVELASRCRSPE